MKLLILVIASRGYPYDELLRLWRSRSYPEWVTIRYLFLNPDQEESCAEDGDTFTVKGYETINPGIYIKTRLAMWWYTQAKPIEFTHILRTNLSSFYRFDLFRSVLDRIPLEMGVGARSDEGDTLLSGTGYCISRDIVDHFLEWMPERHTILGRMALDDCEFTEFIRDIRAPVTVKWDICCYEPGKPIEEMTGFHFRFRTAAEGKDRGADVKGYEEAVAFFG